MTETPARKRRGRKRITSLMLLALVAALELAVRLAIGAPRAERLPVVTIEANPFRGWQMKPGELHYTYEIPVQLNSLGFRAPEIPTKPAGEFRILFLGASYLYGQGVPEHETITARLEHELNASANDGRTYRVINTRHRAYGIRQELGVLEEHGARLAPDLVLCSWCWLNLPERDVRTTCAKLSASGPISYDMNRRIEGAVELEWHMRQLARKSALVMLVHDLWVRLTEPALAPDLVERRTREFGGHIDAMLALCLQLGAGFAFLELPIPSALLGPDPSDATVTRVLAAVRERGVALIDVKTPLAELTRTKRRPPVIPFDGHYDGAAYRVIASAIAQHLMEARADARLPGTGRARR